MATGLVEGGWNALNNIIRQIGKGASPHSASAFFPAAQREKIKSEILKPAGASGQTHRPTRYEMPSVLMTNFWRKRGWVGSPYEKELAVSTKHLESKMLASIISGGRR